MLKRVVLNYQARQAFPLAAALVDEARTNLPEGAPLGTPHQGGWGPELPLSIRKKEDNGSLLFHFELGVSVSILMHEIGQYNLTQEVEEWVIYGATVRWPQDDRRLPKRELRLETSDLIQFRRDHYFGGAYLATIDDLIGWVIVDQRSVPDPQIHVDPLLPPRSHVAKEFDFRRLVPGDKERAVEEAVEYCRTHGYHDWADCVTVVAYPPKGRMSSSDYMEHIRPNVVAAYTT